MMHAVFDFVRGPMVWIALIVFVAGSLYRLISMWRLARKKDAMVFSYFSPYFAFRSMAHWLTPYAARNMRKHPVMTGVTFVFHLCVFALPVFLSSHGILFKESWNISWGWLPEVAADIMTLLVTCACLFFAGRRIFLREVRYLTTWTDFLILAFVALPFVTGYWASRQWTGFEAATLIHMLSGEILVMMIPFTRLSHMLFFPVIRGYMGSEFGAVRRARDW